jgi:hypothetical protein
MKKIPTVFRRDAGGRITDEVTSGCEWVFKGEGVASRKVDGTCCMARSGRLFKRRELKPGDTQPADFEVADRDSTTGKIVGWVPIGDGPEDKWHREAMALRYLDDGTYELLGPKVQGNPEKAEKHILLSHEDLWEEPMAVSDRSFAGLRAWLSEAGVEGIVFRHPNGQMAKIKAKDFGIKRKFAPLGTRP